MVGGWGWSLYPLTQCMVLGGPGNAVVTLLYHGNEHM